MSTLNLSPTEKLEFAAKVLEEHNRKKVRKTKTTDSCSLDTIGDKLRIAIENDVGYTIQCGTCLNFFKSITEETNLDEVLAGLMKYAPTPDWWRAKYKTAKDRRERYSELIVSVVPKDSTPKLPIPLMPIPPVKDSDWYVAVTTAPRQDPSTQQCLDSIAACGWNPTVFAEPGSLVVEGYKYVHNSARLGAFHNWLQTMREALKSGAEYILSAQDDSLFHPDSKQLIEQLMWPNNRIGFISLYTAKHYSQNLSGEMKPIGLNRLITSSLWGACALVFPRYAVEQILDHPLTNNWTGIPPKGISDSDKRKLLQEKKDKPYLIQNVDTLIGQVLNGIGLEMWCVDPSPVQHIAIYSSIGHANSNAGKRNCLRCADHKKPLAQQVFPS